MFERISRRTVVVAAGVGFMATIAVLVAIAVINNDPRIWDTGRFCGSLADFQEPPVPEVCLSFPAYLRQSIMHPPHVVPAIIVGLLAASSYYSWHRDRSQ